MHDVFSWFKRFVNNSLFSFKGCSLSISSFLVSDALRFSSSATAFRSGSAHVFKSSLSKSFACFRASFFQIMFFRSSFNTFWICYALFVTIFFIVRPLRKLLYFGQNSDGFVNCAILNFCPVSYPDPPGMKVGNGFIVQPLGQITFNSLKNSQLIYSWITTWTTGDI